MAPTDAGSGSSHRCQVMSGSSTTLTNSDNDLRRDIRATEMDGQMSIGSVWKWRYGGRDHFWMFSCFSLLFFSSLDHGPVQMASAWVFTTFRVSQVEVEFPCAPDPPKGHPERYWSVVGLRGSYDCVCETVVWLLPSIFYLSYSCTGLCSPGGLRLIRGIM